MAGEQNTGEGSPGVVQSQKAAQSQIMALVQSFDALAKAGSNTDEVEKKLIAEHQSLGKEMSKTTRESQALIRSVKILQDAGKATAQTTTALGQHLARTHKMISDTEIARSEETRSVLEEALARELGAVKQNKDRIAGLNKELREINEDTLEQTLHRDAEAGRARAESGKGMFNKLGGSMDFMSARAGQAGAKVGKFAGGALGQTVATMAKLAKFAGFAMLAFTALRFVLGQVAGRAREASKSGLELGDTFMSASNAGASLRQTASSFTAMHKGAIGANKILELLQSSQDDYIYGVVATGES